VRIEQAFGLEFLLELFKGQLQRAHSLELGLVHNQLVLSARFVNRQIALQDHPLTVFEQLAMRNRFAAEQDAVQLGQSILQREIDVTGILGPPVADLAADPDPGEVLFEQLADLAREFAD